MPWPDVQKVRIADVLLVGPLMIAFGVRCKDAPKLARAAIVATGVATMVYNADRYAKARV